MRRELICGPFICLLYVAQNYFDQYGVFVSIMLSAPVILVSFGILIHAVIKSDTQSGHTRETGWRKEENWPS